MFVRVRIVAAIFEPILLAPLSNRSRFVNDVAENRSGRDQKEPDKNTTPTVQLNFGLVNRFSGKRRWQHKLNAFEWLPGNGCTGLRDFGITTRVMHRRTAQEKNRLYGLISWHEYSFEREEER